MTARRDPEGTRAALLDAGFWEVYRHGYQAASIDSIIGKTGVTKGALYHHFPNKKALGLAIVDEVFRPHFEARWLQPLAASADPIGTLQRIVRGCRDDVPAEALELGCPLNNLSQEMAPLDEDFREHINATFDLWHRSLADAIRRGQEAGLVDESADPERVARFVLAAFEGASTLAKSARDWNIFEDCAESLAAYLETLRAPGAKKRAS